MRRFFLLLSVMVCAIATPLHADEPASNAADAAFKKFYEKEWQWRLEQSPQMASWVGAEAEPGLADESLAAQQQRLEESRELQAELKAIDASALSAEQAINYQILSDQIRDRIADIETGDYLTPINSDSGFHTGLARMAGDQGLRNVDDYELYLSRLADVGDYIDDHIALMREGLKRGITPPKVTLQGRAQSIALHAEVDQVEESAFYAPFKSIEDHLPAEQATTLKQRGRKLVADTVIPAYQRLLKFFREEYLPGARDSLAAYEMPNGKAYYQAQIREYTTLELDAETIHERGMAEVERIHQDMLQVKDAAGFDGDLAAFIEFLRTDEQFYANSADELLAHARNIAKRMDAELPSLFGKLPRQPYGVSPVPEEIAPTYTAGRYVSAPIDSTRAGTYWVNTYDLDSRPLYALPALTLHEAVPGHHLQGALAAERDDHPPFRRFSYISAYGEGWGLYAEYLGKEAGIYRTPYEKFGRLTYEMWRAARLVVDTGIHAKGWSREQAVAFMRKHTALSLHEIETEVNRYISWPGQALSYKLGEMVIRELRSEAEDKLGQEFDLRTFHDELLSLGSVPLSVLRSQMRNWIADQAQ